MASGRVDSGDPEAVALAPHSGYPKLEVAWSCPNGYKG